MPKTHVWSGGLSFTRRPRGIATLGAWGITRPTGVIHTGSKTLRFQVSAFRFPGLYSKYSPSATTGLTGRLCQRSANDSAS